VVPTVAQVEGGDTVALGKNTATTTAAAIVTVEQTDGWLAGIEGGSNGVSIIMHY